MNIIYLGLANWLATLILVEGFVFQWWRDLAGRLHQLTLRRRAPRTVVALTSKVAYLAHCQLCTGVWVAWIIAIAVPGPIHWFWYGLVIKAVGHLTLELTELVKATARLTRARARLLRLQAQRGEDAVLAAEASYQRIVDSLLRVDGPGKVFELPQGGS